MLSDAGGDAATDKRAMPRRWVLQSGRIGAADGAFSLPCTIIDISEDGARVRCDQTVHLPVQVQLVNYRDRIAYCAQPIWSSQPEHGLRFLSKETF